MYAQPEITEQGIKCDECEQWFKKLTYLHLFRKHHLTIDEYKEKWGLTKSQPLEAFYIKKIRQECVVMYRHAERLKPYQLSKKYSFKKGHKNDFERRAQHTLISQRNGRQMKRHTKTSKEKLIQSMRKKWKDPVYRKKSIATYKKMYSTPSMRAKMKAKSFQGWNNPESRKRHKASEKAYWNSPEGKKKASERAKRMWRKKKLKSKNLKSSK